MQKKPHFIFAFLLVLAFIGIGYIYFDQKTTAQIKTPSLGSDELSQGRFEQGVASNLAEDMKEKAQEIRNDWKKVEQDSRYPLHENITSSIFWVGEKAGEDNKNISNFPSAWDEEWAKHFGGVDDPNSRNGYFPSHFVPQENPFYVALPFNDFSRSGKKKDFPQLASWGNASKAQESACKNRWVQITKDDKTVYAQWEDVGPFEENDGNYVFGNSKPKNKINDRAGIDVSPAVRDFLGLNDIDKVDWKFVDEDQVPNGPWKKIVTQSQVFWK